MEVASFNFDDLHMNLFDTDVHVGCFEGAAHIDRDGAIVSVEIYGVNQCSGKPASTMLTVPAQQRNDLTDAEQLVLKVVDYLYGGYEQVIAETLDAWREDRREREYIAAE